MLKSLPRDVPEMDTLDFTTLMLVADMAKTMTKEEILSTFTISMDDLDKTEEIYFTEFFNYGRGMGVHQVGINLIESTKGRQGAQAAMMYLKRFAKEYEGEIEGDTSGSFSFSFGKESA